MSCALLLALPALVWAAIANARPAATGTNVSQSSDISSAATASGGPRPLGPVANSPSDPASVTQHKDCSILPPLGARPFSTEAPPLIRVTIAADGELRDPEILKGTGNDTEDREILACAVGNHLTPIKVNGEPTEVSWVLGFYAWPGLSGFGTVSSNGARFVCTPVYPRRAALRVRGEGDTIMTYRIATDGTTKDIRVQQSSGNVALDEVSSDCVASRRYFPVTHDGQPVEIDWVFKVVWRETQPR